MSGKSVAWAALALAAAASGTAWSHHGWSWAEAEQMQGDIVEVALVLMCCGRLAMI